MAYDLDGLFIVINQHLRSTPELSLEKLARLINIERHTLEKAVRRANGETFRQLRNAVMLGEANKLLKEQPQLTIKEIAFQLGYKSQSAFSRFLRTTSGLSPTQARRKEDRN